MSTKYRLTTSTGYVEFASHTDATTFAASTGDLSPTITEIEFTPPRADVPPISSRQIRLALLGLGISSNDVTTALESLDEPLRSASLIEWEYSTRFARDNPLADLVSQALGWTADQTDALWISARSL